MRIPIIYKVIHQKFQEKADEQLIKIIEARYIISVCFRVRRKLVGRILTDMKHWNLIKFHNGKFVRVLGNSL